MIIESQAYARAGLLGNPSDGYFGKTISISVRNFGASISLYESPELRIEPQAQDLNVYKNLHALIESVEANGYYGGARLIKAAIRTFHRYVQKNSISIPYKNFSIRYLSSIPRQVGLAGSSAIITATMRALQTFYNVDIPKEIMPSVVLEAETEELGINAGLQDRVIQTYEGCVYMDFDKQQLETHGHGHYENLDTSLLPNLYVAYKTKLSKVSGVVLNDIKRRFDKGEKLVVDTLHEIGELAAAGKQAIETREYGKLNSLINENFDLRCKIMDISEANMEMVETARRCGASAKFSGSGGAIVGVYPDDKVLTKLIVEMKKIDVRVLKPHIN
jgi:glucuronokinase